MRSNESNVGVVTVPNVSRSSINRGRFSRKPMRTLDAGLRRARTGVDELSPSLLPASTISKLRSSELSPDSSAAGLTQRNILLVGGDLIEIAVVDPQLCAITDDQLLAGLLVRPEATGRANVNVPELTCT